MPHPSTHRQSVAVGAEAARSLGGTTFTRTWVEGTASFGHSQVSVPQHLQQMSNFGRWQSQGGAVMQTE
jgi:hypothetical protein